MFYRIYTYLWGFRVLGCRASSAAGQGWWEVFWARPGVRLSSRAEVEVLQLETVRGSPVNIFLLECNIVD